MASKGMVALVVGSFFFASSAILIRFATEASAISLTFFRLAIAALVMVLIGFATRSLRLLGKRDLTLVAASGVFLSLHLATFIFAVQETTIANATFLVNTSPIMLAILSPIIIKERTTTREILGVLVATSGILLVADAGNGFRSFGAADFSALLAAGLLAFYSLIGRHLRTSGITTSCYTSYVYCTAALVGLLMVGVLRADTFRTYDTQNILAIVGLALLPTAVGHSLYNYSLGSVKAVTANLFPLLEPIGASVFAVPLFGEVPTPVQIAGYVLILTAVVLVATGLR